MSKSNFYLIQLLLIVLIAGSCSNSKELFNENSEDWEVFGDAKWTFNNNILTGEVLNGSGFLMTTHSFSDFVLQADFKPDSSINSGIFIRCTNKEINPFDCYELNIWDLHPDQKNRTGAIVAISEPFEHVETIDKWNTYRIQANDGHIQVWINEILTADTILNSLNEGFVGIQAYGTGNIQFREIIISPID